jgi:hypothetical protein
MKLIKALKQFPQIGADLSADFRRYYQLTTYNLQLTTSYLQLTTYNYPRTTYHLPLPPPAATSLLGKNEE